MNNGNVVYSALLTPDGTLLESSYKYDYKTHKDKNGKTYRIDGGISYLRCTDNGDENLIILFDTDPHHIIRRFSGRWSLTEKYIGDKIYIRLFQMTDSHLDSCINYYMDDPESYWYLNVLIREKQFRFENEISVL
jgi:hypothetical protein